MPSSLEINKYHGNGQNLVDGINKTADVIVPPVVTGLQNIHQFLYDGNGVPNKNGSPVYRAIVDNGSSVLNGFSEELNKDQGNPFSQLVADYLKVDLAENVGRPILEASGFNKNAVAGLLALPALGLTITKPDRLARGVVPGIATGSDFGPAMRKWNARRNELIEQRRNPQGLTDSRRLKNRKKSLVTAYNDVSTGPTTDPLDVEAYGRRSYKVDNKPQHHLFPKQESYQFVERMKTIGDDDDVLNLFLYAEELDATMGGRLSNILTMDRKPHNILHSNRISDGREMRGMKMKNLVASAKTSDELMDLFDKYIVENIKPSKQEAIALQQAFDQSRNTLSQFKSLSIADRRRL
jgi:hypothetical protein